MNSTKINGWHVTFIVLLIVAVLVLIGFRGFLPQNQADSSKKESTISGGKLEDAAKPGEIKNRDGTPIPSPSSPTTQTSRKDGVGEESSKKLEELLKSSLAPLVGATQANTKVAEANAKTAEGTQKVLEELVKAMKADKLAPQSAIPAVVPPDPAKVNELAKAKAEALVLAEELRKSKVAKDAAESRERELKDASDAKVKELLDAREEALKKAEYKKEEKERREEMEFSPAIETEINGILKRSRAIFEARMASHVWWHERFIESRQTPRGLHDLEGIDIEAVTRSSEEAFSKWMEKQRNDFERGQAAFESRVRANYRLRLSYR